MGEHVDYNDGPVLPAAIDRTVQVRFSPAEGNRVSIRALDLGKQVEFQLDQVDTKKDIDGNPLTWLGVIPGRGCQCFATGGLSGEGDGSRIYLQCTDGFGVEFIRSGGSRVYLPPGTILAKGDMDLMTLAKLAQKAENAYVGVNCGLMDQFASAHGVDQHALYFNTRTLEWHPLPLASQTAIIIADSGMRRALQHSGYNERRSGCEQAVEILSHICQG